MTISGTVRQPRAWVNVGGSNINVLSVTVYQTRHQSASEFTAEMALDDPTNPGVSYWSDTPQITATITGTNGDGTSGVVTMMIGPVDKVNIDFGERIVSIRGRDLTAKFLDRRSDHDWTNQTYLQIVQELAAEHGLSVVTDSGTSLAGKTFNFQEYDFKSDWENEWDILQRCAEHDGKNIFVVGNTLYYVTPGYTGAGTFAVEYSPPSASTYESSNVEKLKCSVDLQIEAGGQATVPTWHQNSKEAFVGTAQIGGGQAVGGGLSTGGAGVQFYRRVPGDIQNQVQTQAQKLAQDVSTFARQVETNGAGDVNVNQLYALSLSGTGSGFDRTYYIDTVTHRFDWNQGYQMTIEAKTIPST